MENSMWTIGKMKLKKKHCKQLPLDNREPTFAQHVGPTFIQHVGPTFLLHVGPTFVQHVGPTFVQHVGPTFFGWAKCRWFCIAQPTLAQQKLQLKAQRWPNFNLLSGWVLASCQVSLNSLQRFQRRNRKCEKLSFNDSHYIDCEIKVTFIVDLMIKLSIIKALSSAYSISNFKWLQNIPYFWDTLYTGTITLHGALVVWADLYMYYQSM